MGDVMKTIKRILGKKWYIRLPVVLIFALVVLGVVGFIGGLIQNLSTTFATAFGLVIAAVLLMAAIGYRKGTENFIEGIPIVLLLFTISVLIMPWLPMLQFAMSVETSMASILTGVALLFGSIYISDAFYDRHIRTKI